MTGRGTAVGPATALALVVAALALAPALAAGASCCGGGGGGGVLAGRGDAGLLDLSLEAERYAGYWDLDGTHKPDPPGSAMAQYRLALAGALRLIPAWQVSGSLPLVVNDNSYGGLSSRTRGLGDATAGLFWEPLDQRSTWRLASAADLVPAVTVGAVVTIPTGVSPYDDVSSSFDVTGRGFWRLDGRVLVDKGWRAWSASLELGYGVAFERWVNRSYGGWVPPARKKPGDRATASLSLGYRLFLGTGGWTLATAAALSWLHEADGTRDGVRDDTTGLEKSAAALTVTWSGTDSDWSARAGLAHAFRQDGWGRNFPTTDTFTVGVRRAFR
jgi:hypothetical protein